MPSEKWNAMPNHDLVLTRQDLALIRAALKFWSEEMPGVPNNVTDAYFDQPHESSASEPGQAEQLMSSLSRCTLGYTLAHRVETGEQADRIYPTISEAQQNRQPSQRIATLLLAD